MRYTLSSCTPLPCTLSPCTALLLLPVPRLLRPCRIIPAFARLRAIACRGLALAPHAPQPLASARHHLSLLRATVAQRLRSAPPRTRCSTRVPGPLRAPLHAPGCSPPHGSRTCRARARPACLACLRTRAEPRLRSPMPPCSSAARLDPAPGRAARSLAPARSSSAACSARASALPRCAPHATSARRSPARLRAKPSRPRAPSSRGRVAALPLLGPPARSASRTPAR
jgi:hypothetical protein